MSETEKPKIIKCKTPAVYSEPELPVFRFEEFFPEDSLFWDNDKREEMRDRFIFGVINQKLNGRHVFPQWRDLAKRHNVPFDVMHTWMKHGEWYKKRKAHEQKRLDAKEGQVLRSRKQADQDFQRRKSQVMEAFDKQVESGEKKISAGAALQWESEESKRINTTSGGKTTKYERVLTIIARETGYDSSGEWDELIEEANAELDKGQDDEPGPK